MAEDKNQNLAIEFANVVAMRSGRAIPYQATLISTTEAAAAADPFKNGGLLPDSWIDAANPRDHAGREIIRLLDRVSRKFARDGKREEQESLHSLEDAAKSEVDYRKYLPAPSDHMNEWLARFATNVDLNSAKLKALYAGLSGFLERFSGSVFSDLSRKERDCVSAFVKNICEFAA